MARRAFSVIELLVVLALLTALTSLAMPALLGRVGGVALEAAARQLGAAIDAARSEAQRLGRPVTLEGRSEPGGALELWIVVRGETEAGDDEAAAADEADEMWGELPEGVRLSASAEPAEADAAGVAPEGGSVAVATFLPDGGVAAAAPLFVVGDAGALRVRINGWTGVARFEAAQPGDGAEPLLEEEGVEEVPEASDDGAGVPDAER